MQCNAMQCNAMQCNAMQCNAMQCNTMHDDIQDSDFQLPGYLPIHRKDAGHLHGLFMLRTIFRLLGG